MKINRLLIENYKSIRKIDLRNPSPFTVFVGPNGAGKSNIFEAIGFSVYLSQFVSSKVSRAVGNFIPRHNWGLPNFKCGFEEFESAYTVKDFDSARGSFTILSSNFIQPQGKYDSGFGVPNYHNTTSYKQFFENHTRLFVNNKDLDKFNFADEFRLTLSASNLEAVLSRILKKESIAPELNEWLNLFVPGLDRIDIEANSSVGTESLVVYEKSHTKPFGRNLISDGTNNIIALLTAVFQSDEPQFLCIEEPENGLNPKVVKELVGFFREQCEVKGHYIWLNTHSQTLVRELTPEEIIIVDKKEGETKIKQIQGMNLHGLKMDEALLSGAIGGGIPW